MKERTLRDADAVARLRRSLGAIEASDEPGPAYADGPGGEEGGETMPEAAGGLRRPGPRKPPAKVGERSAPKGWANSKTPVGKWHERGYAMSQDHAGMVHRKPSRAGSGRQVKGEQR